MKTLLFSLSLNYSKFGLTAGLGDTFARFISLMSNMNITLFNYRGMPNIINKQKALEKLTPIPVTDGLLYNATDIFYPVIRLEVTDEITINNANYVYIDDFNRYYFVTGKTIINNSIIELKLKEDVLMTFQEQILNGAGTIIKTHEQLSNDYLNTQERIYSELFNVEKYDFPNDLFNTEQIIMVTIKG